MWEYENASDAQLANASAERIMTLLDAKEKNQTWAFSLQNIADCFLAVSQQLDLDVDTQLKLKQYLHNYDYSNDKTKEIHSFLKRILKDCASTVNASEKEVLGSAIFASSDYLLTLRRAQDTLTHTTYLYNNEYSYLASFELERFLDAPVEDLEIPFNDTNICANFKAFCEGKLPQDSDLRSLIDDEKYAEAFDSLCSSHYDLAKEFLLDNEYLFAEYFDMGLAYDIAKENFHNDIEYFDIPMDGAFIEFAHNVSWKKQSGAKIFELNPRIDCVDDFLDKCRSIDGDRSTMLEYRVGAPYLHIVEYYHDAPTGTSLTVIPEEWLDDALKCKDVREEFNNFDILRDIISVRNLQEQLQEQSRKSPVAAMYKEEVENYLSEYSFAEIYMDRGFSDLVYSSVMNMANSPAAAKNPKEFFAEIMSLTPKEAFDSEWCTKESLMKDFKAAIADYKSRYVDTVR